MMLEVYKYIDRPSKLPKPIMELLGMKPGSKHSVVIESKFSKAELEQYLTDVDAFSLFFKKSS
jgi:hypothetical protein